MANNESDPTTSPAKDDNRDTKIIITGPLKGDQLAVYSPIKVIQAGKTESLPPTLAGVRVALQPVHTQRGIRTVGWTVILP